MAADKHELTPGPASQPALASRLAGARVAVVGLGISNLALTRFLLQRGAWVTALDAKTPEQMGERYQHFLRLSGETGVEPGRLTFRLGPDYLDGLDQFPVAFLTPGLRKSLPGIQAASRAGTILSSEIHLVFELSRAPILGITGSAGKTTTTALAGEIMKATGRSTYVGGNIGTPLIEVIEAVPADAQVVLELSSFQLQLLARSPQVGVVLNVSPNHLDVHDSMEEYREAKTHIFRYQGPGDSVVLNADRPETRGMAAQARGQVVWFSRLGEVERGAFLRGNEIILRDQRGERVAAQADQIRLPGLHNLENVLAAVAATSLAGAQPAAIHKAVTAFRGVAHRQELVRELDGVRYINDSIATAPDRTTAALLTLGPEPGAQPNLLLIAGGYDKHLPYDALGAEMLGRVRVLLLLGQTADQIHRAVEAAVGGVRGKSAPLIIRGENLDALVSQARRLAKPGEAVLLSPASASYDLYHNFEERGEHFRRLVAALT